jgi:hypothetical protein
MSNVNYTQVFADNQKWGSESPAIYIDYLTWYTRDDNILSYRPQIKIEPLASSFPNTISVDLYVDNVLKSSASIVKNSTPDTWATPIYWYGPYCYIYNKVSGTVPVRFRVYGGGRDYTYNYNMNIVPANSVLLTIANFTIDTAVGVGNAFLVPITKTVSNVYDVLTIKLGATTVATRDGYTSGNVTFSAAELDAIYQIITTSNSATFTFELKTYTNSTKTTQVGTTSTLTSTGTLTSYPAILDASYVNHEDTNTTTVALTGDSSKFFLGYSDLEITVSAKATAQNYATLGNNAYVFEVLGETTQYANQSDSLNFVKTFTSINDDAYNLKVIDSRTNQLTILKTLDVVTYDEPVFSSISVARQNGVEDDILIAFAGTYTDWSDLSTTNSIQTAQYRYKEVGGDYGGWNAITLTTNTGGNFSKTSYNPVDLDVTKAYEFEIQVIDKLGTTTQTFTVPSATPTICLDIGNKLVGIGKIPDNTYTDASIDVAGDMHVAGTIYQNGVGVLIPSSSILNYTENTFTFSSTETITTNRANMSFDAQSDANNTKVYLSSNQVMIDASAKLIFFTFSYASASAIIVYPNYSKNFLITTSTNANGIVTGCIMGLGSNTNLYMTASIPIGSTTITNASTYFQVGVMY